MAGTLDLMNTARLSFYDNLPTALIVQGTSQTFATSSSDAAIIFDTANVDNWGGWSNANPTRYTFQVAGLYLLSGSIAWGGSSAGRRITYLRINGSTAIPGSAGDLASPSTNTQVTITPTVMWQAAVGDYVEVIGNQSSGGSLSTNGSGATSAFIPSLTVQWLHL